MVPAAVRGLVVGPVCRACASESERVRTAGRGPGCYVGAGEAVRASGKSRPALCVVTPIYGEVGAAMTGHFKVNGVGTLWLTGNDEVMAKEVCAVMIVC